MLELLYCNNASVLVSWNRFCYKIPSGDCFSDDTGPSMPPAGRFVMKLVLVCPLLVIFVMVWLLVRPLDDKKIRIVFLYSTQIYNKNIQQYYTKEIIL